ncbi:MAG TPA: hypothetical protein VK859_12525 [bacterium]|jgi:hypothetical protein|nr:hypothetical protein [bacterium]
MGTKANRDSVISSFVEDVLEREGLELYEKWFAQLKQQKPADQKITDFEVRDEMLGEIVTLVTEGNSLILSKKDKLMVEEILNRFLQKAHLLQ